MVCNSSPHPFHGLEIEFDTFDARGLQALRGGLERDGGYRYLSDEWPYYVAGLVFRYMGVPMPKCASCAPL